MGEKGGEVGQETELSQATPRMDKTLLAVDPVSASFGASAIALIAFTYYASAMVAALAFAGCIKSKRGEEG